MGKIQSYTDYVLDLSQSAVWQAPAEVSNALVALDTDGDEALSFAEAQYATLLTPLSGEEITILTADDLSYYDALLRSAENGQRFARFFADTAVPTGPTTEKWVATRTDELSQSEPLVSWRARGMELLAMDKTLECASLLMRRSFTDGDELYFTLHLSKKELPDDVDFITIEINGKCVPLSEFNSRDNDDILELRRDVLDFFFMAIENGISLIPKLVATQYRDYLDALYYQIPLPRMREVTAADLEKIYSPQRQTIKSAAERVLDNVSPVIKKIPVRDDWHEYQINLRCDDTVQKPLTTDEIVFVATIMGQISPHLYGALAVNGVMHEFSVEVVDDEVLAVMTGSRGFIGEYLSDQNKFIVRRSLLKTKKTGFLKQVIQHELGHGIFPTDYTPKSPGDFSALTPQKEWLMSDKSWLAESDDNYFLQAYFDAITKRAKAAKRLPSISAYSLRHVGEFVAECASAYLNGETDIHPWHAALHGPISRAELREKLPHMYVALKLFFEPDSHYFGDLHVFSWESKDVLDKLLNSDQADFILDPDTTGLDIVILYEEEHALLRNQH